MDVFYQTLWLLLVALLWGATNPLIKYYSVGIEQIKRAGVFRQWLAEVWFMITTWKLILSFLLNQCGSVLFYLTLASADLSLAVPISNSLTLLFTVIVGSYFGEKVGSSTSYVGMLLVLLGIGICISSKL